MPLTDQQHEARFEAAVERYRAKIDAMPYGAQRDGYVEGLADGLDFEDSPA